MVRVKWPNGKVVSATTWKRLMGKLRRSQWRELDTWLFRWQMSERAKVWTGSWPNPGGPADEFGRRLGDVGFFEILEDEEETVDTAVST